MIEMIPAVGPPMAMRVFGQGETVSLLDMVVEIEAEVEVDLYLLS